MLLVSTLFFKFLRMCCLQSFEMANNCVLIVAVDVLEEMIILELRSNVNRLGG